MTVLSAQTIRELCLTPVGSTRHPLLAPFEERTVNPATGTTHGLGPCTYDLRLARVDRQPEGDGTWVLPPGGFALASTVERFAMPLDVCGHVMDKSSLARQGLSVFNTHIDPGWEGWLTVELSARWRRIVLSPGMPIAQVKFELLDWPTMQPYRGKYQNQEDRPVPAIPEGHWGI